MANVEENPFGDPFSVGNFPNPSKTLLIARKHRKRREISQDPSVQQAARGSGGGTGTLDDYNPFAEAQRPAAVSTGARGAANPPPTMQPTPQHAAGGAAAAPGSQSYSHSASATAGQDDLLRKQEELERKAAELRRREEDLERRARAGQGTPPHNWPPVPNWLPVNPCFYHDIDVDIPAEFQHIVRMAYYAWMAYALALLTNIIGQLAHWFSGGATGGFGPFLVSIVMAVIFVPCSFLFWYRPLYKAFKLDSSFQFMVFFFCMLFQIIIACLFALGIWTCGWMNTFEVFPLSIFYGLLMLFPTIGFSICAVAMVLLIVKVHQLYRSSGASFAKAQEEFQSGVMSNRDVQAGMAAAAGAAARNTFSSGPQQGGGGRF